MRPHQKWTITPVMNAGGYPGSYFKIQIADTDRTLAAAGMKYAKIIGEKEKAVESVKFDFLGVYRPAVILGNSNTPGVLGYVMPLLHWAMPSKYHSIHKNDLARAIVAQSEQAFLAITRGNAPKEATVKILEYKEMEPFFVKGESDER